MIFFQTKWNVGDSSKQVFAVNMVILTLMISIVTKQSRIVFRDESSYVSVVSPNLRSELYSHPVYPVVTYKPRLFFYVVAEIFSFLDHLLFRLNCLGLFVQAFYSALYLALFAFQYLRVFIFAVNLECISLCSSPQGVIICWQYLHSLFICIQTFACNKNM